jgi:hypothetical protein
VLGAAQFVAQLVDEDRVGIYQRAGLVSAGSRLGERRARATQAPTKTLQTGTQPRC